jgi:hypothetical protein
MPVAEKRRYGHLRIDTSGSLAETREAASALAAELRGLAATPAAPAELEVERVAGCLAAGPPSGEPSPGALLASFSAPEGPDLAGLGRLRGATPWYAASGGDPRQALALASPTAIWAVGRRGSDAAFVAAAGFSVARLCGVDPQTTAALVLLTLAAAGAALGGLAPSWESSQKSWQAEAERWGGPAVPLPEPLRAALAHPRDGAAARAAASGEAEAGVAAALVALGGGVCDREADAGLRRIAEAAVRPRR